MELSPRDRISEWLSAGLSAVDPERLTRHALQGERRTASVIAIGKASPGMCRGAASALGALDGVCISDHREELPPGVELIIGDHPTPGEASLHAGSRALELADQSDLALISGGGSALCELPKEGIGLDYLAMVNRRLSSGGADIEEANLVRGSLSRVKCGGLGPLPTYVISDVAGAGAEFVASGPTIPMAADPERVLAVMARYDIEVHPQMPRILSEPVTAAPPQVLEILADGRTAATAVAAAANADGAEARVRAGWLRGPAEQLLEELTSNAPPGVTVAAGEPTLGQVGKGRGGRNTHSALMAASLIAGTGALFAALASDGVDGTSGAAGAIVDDETVSRGGDPAVALTAFDSASYLERSGDLIPGGPTGTNVADLWLIWKPER